MDTDFLDMEALPETLSLVVNDWCQSLDQLPLCTSMKMPAGHTRWNHTVCQLFFLN